VIVQEDSFDATASITVCAFTSDPIDAPLFRLLVEPTETNGLRIASRLMVDKITTVPKDRLGEKVVPAALAWRNQRRDDRPFRVR
jgi:mRNA interferase MazF